MQLCHVHPRFYVMVTISNDVMTMLITPMISITEFNKTFTTLRYKLITK